MYRDLALITSIIHCFILSLVAQPKPSHLKLIARHDASGVRLRWSPSSPGAWFASNKSGYLLEKTDLGDSTTSSTAVKNNKKSIPINLWPLDRWQTIVKKDSKTNYPAIAAQMIYGKDWNKADLSIAKKIDEQNNRFSYTVISADLSWETAVASGLGYLDQDVIKGHKYLYQLRSLAQYAIDTAFTVVDTRNQNPYLRQPIEVNTKSGDHTINVIWSKEANSRDFTAYYIERSDDGKTFKRLDEVPYLSSDFKKDSLYNNFYVFPDSVNKNYVPYCYRIVGITPFGVESLPSVIAVGMSTDQTPPDQPTNVHTTQLGPRTVRIEWNYEYGNEINGDLRGFIIGRSGNITDGYHPLHYSILNPTTRFYIDDSAAVNQPNYYIVAAIDTSGNNSLSLATYGHLIDSIAPHAPTGLSGKVDTNGVVHLTWKPNIEKDILGYVLFSAHDSTHEFESVTNYHVIPNNFDDTIMVRSLTEQIYYKIVAVDKSYNYSKFSPMLTLQKPDLIAPSPPILDYKQKDSNTVTLSWRPSTSKDVVKHQMLRRSNRQQWKLVFETTNHNVHHYVDKDLDYDTEFEYKVRAIDDAGNASSDTYSYIFKIPQKPIEINNINITAIKESSSAKINWSALPNIKSYLIYRAEGEGPYLTVNKTASTAWTDTDINALHAYSYRIRAISIDGSTSDFSPPVSLK